MENIWSEIRADFEDDNIMYVDAWETDDDNEEGKVIAKINMKTKQVNYIDKRAINNAHAQEIIKDVINEL